MRAKDINIKGRPIPLFSVTFDTKYRAENFTDTDSDTDTIPLHMPIRLVSAPRDYRYRYF